MEDAMRRARATDPSSPITAKSPRLFPRHGLNLTTGRLPRIHVHLRHRGGKASFDDARNVRHIFRKRGFLLGAVTNRAFWGERFRADLRDAASISAGTWKLSSVEVGYLCRTRQLNTRSPGLACRGGC
jgi:hypothetical protein